MTNGLGRFRRAGTMLGVAGACIAGIAAIACSDDDPVRPGAVPRCTGSVDVTVSSGTTPTFSWTPACAVQILLVEQGPTDRWFITATTDEGIVPGVRYGIVPAGAQEEEPAIPLVAGRLHDVTLYGNVPLAPFLANREFTP